MLHIEKYSKVLGLDKVLNQLSEKVDCEDTKRLIKALTPSSELDKVQPRLDETLDAYFLMARYKIPSFSNLKNVKKIVTNAQAGGLILTHEILKVANVLGVFCELYDFKNEIKSTKTTLDRRLDAIIANKILKDKIRFIILSEDEINDNATENLASIRKKIRINSNKIRDRLDKIIKSSSLQKYLQDALVTVRDGRFVVPVKSEYRKNVPGLVHDTSSSGATLFIEPMSVVEANNELKVLFLEEKNEIEKILKDLSSQIGAAAESILQSYKIAIELDMIFAKADLAYKMNAVKPNINVDGKIDLKKARHPLIDKNKVVPIDIKLGLDFDTLVVTGPNTGGKTVALKTVGLFTLMIMCGLLVPAAQDSTISIFDNILCDIGDEQSIEQSLSTFSSHITNIIKILDSADKNALVLLDELGAGTDPIEGAALARAILESLENKGAKVIATTHYSELKAYALSEKNVENACCEFDINTLKPTYKLLVGMPGSSNAFAISEKLGINHGIINRAKKLVSDEQTSFEEIIKGLENTRKMMEVEYEEIKKENNIIKKEKNEILKQRAALQKLSENEIKKAYEKAAQIVNKTMETADEVLEEAKKIQMSKDYSSEEIKKLKSNIENMEKSSDPVIKRTNEEYTLPRELKNGDRVLVFDINQEGEVLKVDEKSDIVLIKIGAMKTRAELKNLRLLKGSKKATKQCKVIKTVKNKFTAPTKRELDLRGKTAIEAIMELDSFIDTAILSGVDILTIIHGKGTGVLRKEIQVHLKSHPMVKSYRLGVFGEGEAGVTVVELK